MDADLTIERQGACAHQARELAGGTAPREIHLEETVLRVQKSQRPRRVGAIRPADRGDAKLVPSDRHRLGKTFDAAFALELRQAGPKLGCGPGRRNPGGGNDYDEHDDQRSEQSAQHACQY
jgi:hypothetical protein